MTDDMACKQFLQKVCSFSRSRVNTYGVADAIVLGNHRCQRRLVLMLTGDARYSGTSS